jgi:hypothetical protein
MISANWCRHILLAVALSSAASARAAEQQVRMTDGSQLTLHAVLRFNRREHRGQSRAEATDALVIWTRREHIPPGGSVFTIASLLDRSGREYPLTHTGGVFQGPSPTEWPDQWMLRPPPAGEGPWRLRIRLREEKAGDCPAEFPLQELSQGGRSQFVGRTLDEWMAAAVDYFDPDAIWTLLDLGARAHVRGDYGFTPLMVAAFSADRPLVQALLDRGVALDSRNAAGATALFYALYFHGGARSLEIASLLLSRGADPNLGSASLGYPLGWGIGRGNTRLVQELLARGARPGKLAIAMAREKDNPEVVRILEQAVAARGATTR